MLEFVWDLFLGLFRMIIWIIFSFCCYVCDIFLGVFKLVVSMNLFEQYPIIWKLYFFFMFVSLGFFVTYQIYKLYFNSLINEDNNPQASLSFNVNTIIKKLIIIVALVVLVPVFLNAVSYFSSTLTKIMPKLFGFSNDIQIQNLFCDVTNNACPPINYDNVFTHVASINEKVGGQYKYFPNTLDMVFAFIGCYFVFKIFFTLCISIVTRNIGVLFRIIIAAYIFAKYLDDRRKDLQTWLALNLSDIMMNVVQSILVILALNLSQTNLFKDFFPDSLQGHMIYYLAKLCVVIGALMAILNAPGNLSQFVGSDISATNALQQANFVSNTLGQSKDLLKTAGLGAAVATGYAAEKTHQGSKVLSSIGQSIGSNILNKVDPNHHIINMTQKLSNQTKQAMSNTKQALSNSKVGQAFSKGINKEFNLKGIQPFSVKSMATGGLNKLSQAKNTLNEKVGPAAIKDKTLSSFKQSATQTMKNIGVLPKREPRKE